MRISWLVKNNEKIVPEHFLWIMIVYNYFVFLDNEIKPCGEIPVFADIQHSVGVGACWMIFIMDFKGL